MPLRSRGKKTTPQHQLTHTTDTLFTQLLSSENYSNAIELYLTVRDISEDESKNLRTLFIQHTQNIQHQTPTNFIRIHEAISHYTSAIYDDIEILLLQARIYLSQQRYTEGLNAYQQTKVYAYSDEQKKYYRRIQSVY